MMKKIRKPLMLLLTMSMIVTILPVNVSAKKLGKIPMAYTTNDDLRDTDGLDLFSWDEQEKQFKVDYPIRGYSWYMMYSQLYCKPGDTFTFVTDDKKFEQRNHDSIKTYGKVLWHTSDSNVATVNKNGKVTVKGEGYAVITAGIMEKGKNIYGEPFDHEVILYHHHIFSGPVLQLKKGNVKAVAKNANKIYKDGRRPIVRTKGSMEETKELFQAFVKEYNKLGHNARGEAFHEIGNFTYWW